MSDRTPRADGEPTRQRLVVTLRAMQGQGKFPTAKELALATGISFTNVRNHLEHLERSGRITYRDVPVRTRRREIVLADEARQEGVQRAAP
ncbi:MAG TPA: hypothetical protein VKT52_09265 [Ktedonobacterales bacterium]|nr:hypothetical protein [Ktedonobacterales bacterium]